jgi:hypothetical protein
MTQPPVLHCMVRAKERYGIDLSFSDVDRLARRCLKGEGHTGGKPDGTQFHILIEQERVLWIVYRPPAHGGRTSNGKIITVMPSSVGATVASRHAQSAARRRGEYRPFRKAWH